MKNNLITKLVVSALSLSVLGFYVFSIPERHDTSAMEEALALSEVPSGSISGDVLGEKDENPIFFTVNVPSRFKKNISAPNIIYSVTGGEGVTVTEGQSPSISNTGVLSLQSLTGDLSLSGGNGIEINGLEVSNTLSFVGSGGTTVSKVGDTVTVSSSTPDYTLSGWTKLGTSVGLTTATDSVVVDTLTFGNATITNGKSIRPDTDLGSDLGSAALRFNNLYVGNINSNSSTSTAGQATFTYEALSTALTEASVLINPTAPVANGQLLGLSVAGYQRALIDEDGDLTLGYNDAISAPASDYPLSVYGHNGTNVSFIDTSGNAYFAGDVGIGTNNPTEALHVNSNSGASFQYSGSSYSILITPSGGTFTPSYIGTKAATSFGIGVDSTTKLLIDTNGNVGIGTDTPLERFSVVGNILAEGYKPSIKLHNTTYGTPGYWMMQYGQNYGLELVPNSTLSANATIHFTTTGNVGIGTDTPGYKLDVAGNLRTANGVLTLFSSNGTPYVSSTAGKNLRLTSGGSVTDLNGITVSTTGEVGIGTTSPAQKLDVNGNIISSGGIIITTGGSLSSFYSGQIQSGVAAIGAGGAVGYGSNETVLWSGSGMPLVLGTAGTEHLRISSSGDVGIGTISPSAQLDVSGVDDLAITSSFRVLNNSGQTLIQAWNDRTVYINSSNGFSGNTKIGTTEGTISFNAGYNNLFTKNQMTFYSGGDKSSIQGFNVDPGIGIGYAQTTINPNTGTTLSIKGSGATSATNALVIENSSLSKLFTIRDDGNVGIGETAPTVKLDVNGTIMASALQIDNTNANIIQLESSLVLRGNEGIRFLDWSDSAWTERMRIDNVGNVGIGTDTPLSKLDLSNTAPNSDSDAIITLGNRNYAPGTDKSLGAIDWYNGDTSNPAGVSAQIKALTAGSSDGGGDLVFSTRTEGAAEILTEYMRITNDGKVGIGIDNPSESLQVNVGNVNIPSNGYGIKLSYSALIRSGTELLIGSDPGWTKLSFFNAGAREMTLDSVGLGIHDTTPSYSLDVTGMMRATEGVVTYTKAGTISDVDFTETPIDGLMGVDSTNGRLYFRHGGAWHYVAQTAGFQIPEYETFTYDFNTSSFDTSSPLANGDFLIPFVEGRMSDGAIHGLYTSFNDVKDQLFADELSRILSLEQRVTALETAGLTTNPLLSSTGSIGSIATWTDSLWTFLGDVTFNGSVTLPTDTAGTITIPAGSQETYVAFTAPYDGVPVVTTSILSDSTSAPAVLGQKSSYAVTDIGVNGFTISLLDPAIVDTSFSWIAILTQ